MKRRTFITTSLILTLAMSVAGCSSTATKTPPELIASVPSGIVEHTESDEFVPDPEYMKSYSSIAIEDEEEDEDEVKLGDNGLPLPEGPESDLDDNVLIVLAKDFIDDGYTYYPAKDVARDSFFLGTDEYYFYRGFMALLETDTGFSVRYHVIAPLDLLKSTILKDFDYEEVRNGQKITFKVKGSDNITLEYDTTCMLLRYYVDTPVDVLD